MVNGTPGNGVSQHVRKIRGKLSRFSVFLLTQSSFYRTNFKGLFVSYFLKLFCKNIKNIILVFFKNYSYYLNLVFYAFFTIKKNEPNMFPLFFFLVLFFRTKNVKPEKNSIFLKNGKTVI